MYSEAQKVSHHQIIKKCIKSCYSLSMRLNFFVRLKYQSSTIILSVCTKHSTRDVLCDAINKCLTRKVTICITYGKG